MATTLEVLIVEDEPVVLRVAGKALAAYDISFAESENVADAAARLSKQSFKVILTDLKLPEASGFEILELAPTLSPTPQVVTITGYATLDNVLESFRLGTFDFLPKPFDVDELISVVDRALRFFDRQQSADESKGSLLELDPRALLLGHHAWALVDSDGTATLGAAETVAGVIGPLAAIELVGSESHTVQGRCFCKLTTTDGKIHRIRAPLSGQILTRNPALDSDPDLVSRAPFAGGWLARIIPSDLEKEIPKLSRHGFPATD